MLLVGGEGVAIVDGQFQAAGVGERSGGAFGMMGQQQGVAKFLQQIGFELREMGGVGHINAALIRLFELPEIALLGSKIAGGALGFDLVTGALGFGIGIDEERFYMAFAVGFRALGEESGGAGGFLLGEPVIAEFHIYGGEIDAGGGLGIGIVVLHADCAAFFGGLAGGTVVEDADAAAAHEKESFDLKAGIAAFGGESGRLVGQLAGVVETALR